MFQSVSARPSNAGLDLIIQHERQNAEVELNQVQMPIFLYYTAPYKKRLIFVAMLLYPDCI